MKPQCLRIAEFLYTFGVNPIGLRARKGAHTARIESPPKIQKRSFTVVEATLYFHDPVERFRLDFPTMHGGLHFGRTHRRGLA